MQCLDTDVATLEVTTEALVIVVLPAPGGPQITTSTDCLCRESY